MAIESIKGRSLVAGTAQGTLLVSDVGLSFWGGVDPLTGDIVDQHHPLNGANLSSRILAIPSGRGSCSGSGALLELLLNDKAPAALVVNEFEEILTLGVVVAEVIFERSIPVLCIDKQSFARLRNGDSAEVDDDQLRLADTSIVEARPAKPAATSSSESNLALSAEDGEMLDGTHGKAAQVAMQILTRMAALHDAFTLIDITQAHIDACVYHGPSSLRFAEQLVEWGARVRVPTTLNAISVDKQRWRTQGVDPDLGEPASQLGDAYVQMGAAASFTCAPYLLDSCPVLGEQIVWAESNAVMYANSVLGARTQKYPDFLDVCIALTGRAPFVGCHLDAGREPTICVNVAQIPDADDAFWPLLGYHIGLVAGNELPLVCGLESTSPTQDDLKSFSAAFATTSSTPMFHIAGITPEADAAHAMCSKNGLNATALEVTAADLLASWRALNTATDTSVDLICLGNPHFSLTECAVLALLCANRQKKQSVGLVVTVGREIHEQARGKGYVATLEDFGARFVTDTCWCMLTEPMIPPAAVTLMTNSAKYAHYGPGLVGRKFHYGSLAECVDAVCLGFREAGEPGWLSG